MYKLKPVLQNAEIALPGCMYTLKPVNLTVVKDTMKDSKNSEDNQYADLESRQKRILEQLEVLKQTLLSMRNATPQTSNKQTIQAQTLKPVKEKIQPIDTSLLTDIVLNANPECIPYGILALKNLWKERLQIIVDVFVHSTVVNYPDSAKKFTDEITKRNENVKIPALKVVLIWKDVDAAQLISSATKYSPISGEVNILRYLNRIGPKEFLYDKTSNAYQATIDDLVLDTCYLIALSETSHKDRQFHLQQLNQRLGKQKFFNGNDDCSFVDLAVSSTLKQISSKNSKELPGNLPGYLSRVSVVAGY